MNNIRTKVSLIISTYNWVDALRLSLLSIKLQSILPDEVIIADDGSREDTAEMIQQMKEAYPCPLIHVWHEDTGFRLAAIRNKAIARASNEYIIQIDGDIILDKYFIQDHLSFALPGTFVSGSRVLLTEKSSNIILENKCYEIALFQKGLVNRLNALRCKLLRDYYRFRYKNNNPYYVKGCNMAFWREDLIKVNGYDENIVGWGKEDSELAVRLMAYGIKKQFLKFGGVMFHIYHPFNSREKELDNINILENSIKSKISYCKNGLDKYL